MIDSGFVPRCMYFLIVDEACIETVHYTCGTDIAIKNTKKGTKKSLHNRSVSIPYVLASMTKTLILQQNSRSRRCPFEELSGALLQKKEND